MNGTDIQYSVEDDETDSMYKPLKHGDVNGDGGNAITPIIKNGVSNGRAGAMASIFGPLDKRQRAAYDAATALDTEFSFEARTA